MSKALRSTITTFTIIFLAGLGFNHLALAKNSGAAEEKNYLRAVVQIEVGQGVGSGFFVNSDGILVTAQHVVGNERGVKVKLFNGQYTDGVVMSINKESDLAILKTNLINTPFLKLGESEHLKAGEKVSLLGSPIGLDHSVIQATIAASKRKVEKQSVLQLDGNVNSGLSGGAAVNRKGEVVGIVTMKAEKAQGIGFATPVEDLFKYLSSINVATISALPEREFQKRDPRTSDGKTFETPAKWPVILIGAAVLMLLSSTNFLAINSATKTSKGSVKCNKASDQAGNLRRHRDHSK